MGLGLLFVFPVRDGGQVSEGPIISEPFIQRVLVFVLDERVVGDLEVVVHDGVFNALQKRLRNGLFVHEMLLLRLLLGVDGCH